ncbi:MAG: alpha/beta hydrolase [Rhodospirillaceae bacterium]
MKPNATTLQRPDGAVIAYDRVAGKAPGIFFLHGLRSDRKGSKAAALMAYCQESNLAFLSIDMYGHGESSGDFRDGCISQWTDDAVAAIDHLTEGPQILVGSSMGGWVMLRAALARPHRVSGLVGIAAAPDFTEDLIWNALSKEEQNEMKKDGFLEQPSDYDQEPYYISYGLIEDGRDCLVMHDTIPIHSPVRLLHGQKDNDVPFSTSLALAEIITSSDVETILIKDGDHRLSQPDDLSRLVTIIEQLRMTISASL